VIRRLRQGIGAILIALGALVAAGAGHAAQKALDDEPYGPGYRGRAYSERYGGDPYHLYLLLKVEPLDGKVKICGVYIADMSDRNFAWWQGVMLKNTSTLKLGAPDKRGVRARPSFLAVKRATVEMSGGRPRLPLEGLRANCVVTDSDWEDRYATEPFGFDLPAADFGRRGVH
jgi:hypothetical protein